jgi:hypothetical protein
MGTARIELGRSASCGATDRWVQNDKRRKGAPKLRDAPSRLNCPSGIEPYGSAGSYLLLVAQPSAGSRSSAQHRRDTRRRSFRTASAALRSTRLLCRRPPSFCSLGRGSSSWGLFCGLLGSALLAARLLLRSLASRLLRSLRLLLSSHSIASCRGDTPRIWSPTSSVKQKNLTREQSEQARRPWGASGLWEPGSQLDGFSPSFSPIFAPDRPGRRKWHLCYQIWRKLTRRGGPGDRGQR